MIEKFDTWPTLEKNTKRFDVSAMEMPKTMWMIKLGYITENQVPKVFCRRNSMEAKGN